MFELFNILFIFTAFLLLTCVPLNIFNDNNNTFQPNLFKIKSLNLTINLNILLLISLLPITVSHTKNYILIFYLAFFILIYWKKIFNFFNRDYLYKFITLFVIFFILAFNIMYNLELKWHAQIYDYLKYLVFFQDGIYSELNSYDWGKIGSAHFHPHFGQYLWALFSRISLLNNEIYGRFFHLFLYCFSLLCLVQQSVLTKTTIRLIFFIALVLLTYDYEFFSGTQEILIFSFLVLVSVNVFNIFNKKKYLFDLCSCLLILNLLLWTKSEGFIYGFILILAIFFSPILKKDKFIVLSIYLALNLFKYVIFELNDFSSIARPGLYTIDFVLNMDLGLLLLKIKQTIFWLIYYLSVNEIWIICLICLMLLIFKMKNSFINYKFLFVFLVADILFIFVSYVFPTIDTVSYIRATFNRELFSTSGFFIIAIIIYTNLLLDKKY